MTLIGLRGPGGTADLLTVSPPRLSKGFLPVGPLAVTWSELRISLQTAVILFPINLVVGRLFPLTQPQETLPPVPQAWAPCLSDAPAEPPSLTEVIEVSWAAGGTGVSPPLLCRWQWRGHGMPGRSGEALLTP